MVVVIGYQPENDWLDVINAKLPVDPAQTQVTFTYSDTTYKGLDWTFSLSHTRLSSFNNYLRFTTSFGIEGIGSNGNNAFSLY